MTTPPAGQPSPQLTKCRTCGATLFCPPNLEGGDSPARESRTMATTGSTDAPVIPSNPASRAEGQPEEASVEQRHRKLALQIWPDTKGDTADWSVTRDAIARIIATSEARAVADAERRAAYWADCTRQLGVENHKLTAKLAQAEADLKAALREAQKDSARLDWINETENFMKMVNTGITTKEQDIRKTIDAAALPKEGAKP